MLEENSSLGEWSCPRCDKDEPPLNSWNYEENIAIVDPDTKKMVHPDKIQEGDVIVRYTTDGYGGGGDPRDGYVKYLADEVLGVIGRTDG
jgi:hypothetical protein